MLVNFTANADTAYAHQFQLHSPPFAYETWSCLRVVVSAMSDLNVRLACATDDSTYSDRLLHRSSMSLGYEQSLLQFNIEPTKPIYERCSVIFVTSVYKTGVASIINDVQLSAGKCASKSGTKNN